MNLKFMDEKDFYHNHYENSVLVIFDSKTDSQEAA